MNVFLFRARRIAERLSIYGGCSPLKQFLSSCLQQNKALRPLGHLQDTEYATEISFFSGRSSVNPALMVKGGAEVMRYLSSYLNRNR